MSTPNSTAALDIAHHLHPYTNARKLEREGPRVIAGGDGIHVIDEHGRRYIEAMAGLWSVAVGFSEPRLVEAARAQMEKLPYYHVFAQKSHEPAARLADRLASLTPPGLDHIFFTNSGSEAIDTIVKMVWFRNNARGLPKKKTLLARRNAYHGITVAAGSLTGLPWNHLGFDLPAIPVVHLTTPHAYEFAQDSESEEAFSQRLADELEAVIAREGAETIAAFVGEPLIGAGGVLLPPAGYWQKIQAICRRNDILIVADEVITGFGRTGAMFGCDTFGIEPDIMAFSKQLTSSYMPLAAVAVSDAVYGDIADHTERLGNFGHGFTASGHPVATAVALENLDIIEERELVANAAAMGEVLGRELARLADHPLVGQVRRCGLIAAVEIVADKQTRTYFEPRGAIGGYIFERTHHHGLIVRNIRDAVALCPPLIIREDEVVDMVGRLAATLDDALEHIARERPKDRPNRQETS